jgi:hypothetical protein
LLPLRRERLMRWSEPKRRVSDAAIWAWGGRGRPYALVAIERFTGPSPSSGPLSWGLELVSLADEPLTVQGARNPLPGLREGPHLEMPSSAPVRWAPEQPGVRFRDVPGAPPPAATARERLAQMAELIRRFAAVSWPRYQPAQQTKLRLNVEPMDRYSDTGKGQLDVAIFVFADAANPEVLVLLEAQGTTAGDSVWSYAVAPVTVAALEVSLDGKSVWTQQYHTEDVNTPEKGYFTVLAPLPKATP